MKTIIFLVAFQLLVQNLFCNDVLLSKFHQNGYKIKNVRFDPVRHDENFLKLFNFRTFKYNRTTEATNGTIIFKVSTQDKIELLLQTYKFMSNEYRHFAIRFQVNLKKSFDANIIGLQKVKNCGNFTTFYFYKDVTYHACNFVIDETCFPPLLPTGQYRSDLSFLYLDKEIALMNMFFEVYTPIKYPKH